nr:hypothetical protein HK105_005681 [Polyrhizophydium stewartii]
MAAPRRPSLGAASNVIEFGMPERRRSAARPRSVSHLDLSALSKRDQPDAARARTPAMVLKGESMTSLGAPGNMSPLKSARLSQFLGRQIPGQVPVDQITDQRNKALHRVHSPVDRQAAPSRSDFTNEIKVHAESIHRSNRATTVPTHIGPRMFEPLANAAPESERPKTVATQRGNMTGTEERKIRRSLVVTLGPRQANSVMFGQRGEHGAMAATGDSLRKAPTPCPSICVAPELPDIQRKRFVQLRPLTSPDVFMTTHKQFIVSMGRVVRDSDAYQHFLILASRVFPEPAIEFLVQRIERFCANYMECSYERLIAILSRPILRLRFCETDMLSCLANDKEARPAWNQSYRVNFCLELIRVRVQVDAVTSTAGQRYRAKDGFMAAVVKIQATWRMHKLRVIHLEFVEKLRAGERFRQKWLIRRLISRIQASREATLRTEWAELKTKKRIILHLPSMTFGTTTCAKYENMHSWQIRQLGRLIDLLDPNVSVIYVTTLLSADVERFLKQTIGFTFDLSELIRAKRLLLITLKKPEFCAETVSLAGILMCTPVALRKISSFIKDQQAYMVPAACGRAELDLAHAFNIPVYGSFEANLELAHCRTAQRDIIIRSGVPHTPGASRLKDERSLYHELDRLIKQHPHITRWLFKIDKEMEGRGIAYVDVRELHAESESAHDEDEVDAETTTSRLLRGSVLSHCNHPLRDKMYRCVHFLRRDLWTSWNHYLKSFLFFGGVIEACAPHADHESESLEYPIVHFLIEPDNAVKILATSSLRSVDHSKLVAFVDLVARDCIDRGIMGHITCEFVAWKLADMFEHTIWCTAIKPHFTENMSQAYFMLLMTACPALHPDGKIYYDLNLARRLNLRYLSKVPYVDMDKVRQVSNTERIYDEADYEERVGIYAPRLIHQNLEVLDSRLFGGLCLESGIVFDSKWKSGTHIPLVECYGKQSYAMMCINRNLETALEMMLQNIVIIARRLTGPVAVHSNFMEVAQHLSHMLSNVRPYSYVHKPAVTKASPNAQKLSDLENALNNHIALPVSRMLGLLEELGKLKDDRSSKRGMSPTTINLLNAGIPSKMLANFYSDFGREKLEVPDKSSKRNATRVPPGLPMDEYMAIMEHLAGLDDDGAEESGPHQSADPAAMRVAIMRGQSLAVFKEEKPVRTPSPLAKPRRRSTIGPASPDRLSTATSPVPDSPSVGGVQAPSRRGSSRRASEMDIPVAKLAAQPRVRWTQSMARIDSEAAATSTPGTETPPAAAAFKRRLPDRR